MRLTSIIPVLLLTQLLVQSPCYAIDIKIELEKLHQRTLIVVVETAGKHSSAKLSSEEQFAYKKVLDSYNLNTKDIIEKHWKFNTTIEFKTWEEVKSISENRQGMYLILFACRQSSNIKYADFLDYGLFYYPSILVENDNRDYLDFVTMYKFSKLEDWKKGAIVTRTIMNLWPLEEDILFSVQYIQCLLNESIRMNVSADNFNVSQAHHPTLKKSTLLLKDQMLTMNRIKSEYLESVYPFTTRVTTHDSIRLNIFHKEDVVYVQITPQLISTGEAYRLGYEHVLMNAKTGMIVSYVRISTGILHATSGHVSRNKYISMNIFDRYLKIKGYKEEDIKPEMPKTFKEQRF